MGSASLPLVPPPFSPSPPCTPSLSSFPLFQLWDLGKHCKLLQLGLGRNPSANRFWYILALKSGINNFNDFSNNQLHKFREEIFTDTQFDI